MRSLAYWEKKKKDAIAHSRALELANKQPGTPAPKRDPGISWKLWAKRYQIWQRDQQVDAQLTRKRIKILRQMLYYQKRIDALTASTAWDRLGKVV